MRLLALVLVITAVVCVDASAQQAAASTTRLIRLFDSQGNPQPVVSSGPSGGPGSVAWSMCPVDGAPCFAAGAAQTLTVGQTAPGTVIVANGVWDGQPIALRATWLGTVTAAAPPVLHGRAIVGTQVQGSGGSWLGGWGDDLSAVRVQACRTRDARNCQTLTTGDLVTGEPTNGPSTVTARFTGWYLFAVDIRAAREVVPVIRPAIKSIGPLPPVGPGQTVSFSAPVGPVVGPNAALRRRALYRDGRPQLGTVRCPVVRCTAVVRVRRGAVTRTRTMRVTGTEAIAPRLRMRPGVWRVAVTIDGGPAAQRRVTVSEGS